MKKSVTVNQTDANHLSFITSFISFMRVSIFIIKYFDRSV